MAETSLFGALTSEAVARNRDPILDVLTAVLPRPGRVLEVASGTGEHAVHVAAALPDLVWQPSDRNPDALRSIEAHRAMAGLPNLERPLPLDLLRPPWPGPPAHAIVAINMVHISPWTAKQGLFDLCAQRLALGGVLYLYGPFIEVGVETAPGNAAFDAGLRQQDPAWGLRRVDEIRDLADTRRLALVERIAMPANNLSLVFRRS